MSGDLPGPLAGWRGGVGDLPAGSRLAGYRLGARIGQGGMAVVYRAMDEQLGREVALKVLSPALSTDEEFRQRFIRESRAAAAVDDPHIIPVYGAGEADGVLYIAMRYVADGDVRALLRASGRLSSAKAAGIVSPVASALDAAHAAGLVHRDVKPANMLLDVRPGRPDHVYLSDFGLSKSGQGTTGLTGSGLFLGTLDYAAPEQIEGRAVDGRTDQYALACAAFELLAGEPPFRRDEGLAVLYAQLSAPPPSLAQLNAGLDRAVDAVLARGLAKAPAERFSGCGDFADALRVALGLDSYNFAGHRPHPPDRRTATVITAGSASVPVRSMQAMTTIHGPAGTQSAEPDAADLTAPRGALVKRRERAARGRILAASLAVAVLAAGALGAVFVTRSRKPPTHPPIAAAAQKKSTSPAPTPTASAAAVSPADFRVCTLPADGCTTSYSRVSMKTEPTQIVTSADGSGYVKYLTWSGWATQTAHGTGVLEVDNCTPNCAEGTYSGYPATITLSGLTPYGHGKQAYSVMVISAPSAPYPQEPFTTGLVP